MYKDDGSNTKTISIELNNNSSNTHFCNREVCKSTKGGNEMRSGRSSVAASYTVIDEEIKDKGNAKGNGLTIYYTNDARTM